MWGDFHFLRPLWLLALVPLAWLAWRWLRLLPLRDPWARVVDAHLLRHLGMGREAGEARKLPVHLVTIGWALAAIALAGPTWSRLPAVKFRPDVPPLIVVLDLSRSMDAFDAHPSRLGLAKAKLGAFLDRLPPREVGLVAFAGAAHVVMPPTEDLRIVKTLLPYLGTSLMPAQGSAAGPALDLAWELIRSTGHRRGDALLASDGGDPDAATTARRLRSEGLRVSVLGLGTASGGFIPTPDGNALMHEGRPVETRLDSAALEAVARAGGGAFAVAGAGEADIDGLLPPARLFSAVPAEAAREPGPETALWRDRGVWLVYLLLPIAALAFRRGWLGGLLLAGLLNATPAQAFDWNSLWKNDDQRALEALLKGDMGKALELFRDPFWRAVVHYRLHDYRAAAEAFAALGTAAGEFNRANALVQMGRWEEAEATYREALRRDPNLEAAAANRKIVAEALAARAAVPAEAPQAGVAPPGEEGPGKDKAKPWLEEFIAEMGGDRQLKDIPGPTPRHGVKAQMGSGAILAGNEKDVEGETSAGTGQASRKAGFAGQDEESVRRPGTKAGQAPPGGAPAPEGATVPPPDKDLVQDARKTPPEGRTSRGQGRAVGASASTGRVQAPATGGEPEDTSQHQDPEPLSGGTAGERTERAFRDERVGDPTDAQGRPLTPEQRQSLEQWLERIPDDPGGLLREKFRREAERARVVAGGRPW